MQIVDTGVLTPSFMDFSLPSEFAKSALYYCPQFGQFICNSDYRIERNGIDQYLLIYINSGSLCIRTDGMTAEAHEGEIALFDCRKPHCYWCPDKVDFYWFHFNGAGSKQYTEYLTERFGLVHEKQPMLSLKDQFHTVVHSAQYGMSTQFASMNEHQISIAVHSILGGLASQTVRTTVTSELLAPALAYIHGHFADDISLDDLAGMCGISKSHFIRSFKRYVGCTPHEYLLQYRLRQSKRLLLSSDLTVERLPRTAASTVHRQRRSGLFRSDFTRSDVICVLKNTEWVLTLSWGSKRIDTKVCP